MPALLKKVSTVTEKGQVTIPKSVRDALGIAPGGQVAFVIGEDLSVSLEKPPQDEGDDPVIDRFLAFLADDLERHPGKLSDIPASLVARMRVLSGAGPVDPDAPIDGDVSL